jgi:hypothetical protein
MEICVPEGKSVLDDPAINTSCASLKLIGKFDHLELNLFRRVINVGVVNINVKSSTVCKVLLRVAQEVENVRIFVDKVLYCKISLQLSNSVNTEYCQKSPTH